MSELRDARLRKALQDAPDDDLRPQRATRDAIFARAHEEVRPPALAPWWQRWLGTDGTTHMPWNAAFATLAVATLVTVIWHEREVPDAQLDSVQAPVAARATAPASAATAPAAKPESTTAPTPPLVGKQVAPEPSRPRARPAAPAQPESNAAPAESPPAVQGEARGSVNERAAQDFAAATSRRAADAATGVMRDEAPRPELAKAGPAAAPMAAPARAPRLAAVQSPSLPGDAGITALRITLGGRVIEAPLDPSSQLGAQIRRLAAVARSGEPFAAPVDTRIELMREGQAVGVLELAGPQVRWSPRTPGEAGGTARPDAALLQTLRDELARLAR